MRPEPGKMNAEGVTGIEPVRCLECGHQFDSVGAFDSSPSMPSPGDAVLCIRCGAVQTYEAGRLRAFTKAEAEALIADTEQMNEIAKHVQRIRILRAGVN